jgi:hypothetical protein
LPALEHHTYREVEGGIKIKKKFVYENGNFLGQRSEKKVNNFKK